MCERERERERERELLCVCVYIYINEAKKKFTFDACKIRCEQAIFLIFFMITMKLRIYQICIKTMSVKGGVCESLSREVKKKLLHISKV